MASDTSVKEPLIRLSKKDDVSNLKAWCYRGIALVLGLVAVAVFMKIVIDISPIELYSTMLKGAFGNKIYLSSTIVYTTKLLCIAVALAPAFKMRFWNIGAEGQLLAGGLATAIVMIYCSTALSPALLMVVMFIAAAAAGALVGFFPAFFKAKFNTNETLFTLMMNYVVIKLVDFFYDKWKGTASSLGKINRATKAGYLPEIFDTSWALNAIIVLVLTVLVFLYLKKTKHGYEIAVVGESINTAKYAGINVDKVVIRTMLMSGAICGVCGFLTVAGQDHTISSSTTGGGYGFTAIIVAWLAKFNTIQMVFISLFIVMLERGTNLIANSNDAFDSSASKIVIGIVLFFVIGAEFFINYKLNFRKKNA